MFSERKFMSSSTYFLRAICDLDFISVSVFHNLEDEIRGKFGCRKFPVKLRQLNSVFSNIRGTQICYYMLLKFSVNNCRTNNCRVCVRVF